MTLLLSPMMIRRPACPGSSQRAGGARHQMTAGEPLLLLLLVGGALLLRATPAHQPPSGLLTTCAVRQGTIWWRWPEPRMGGTGESTAATVPARLQVLPASTRWDNPAYIRWPIFGGCKSSLWRRNDKNRGQEAHQIILTVKMSALVFSRIEQVSTWAILVPHDLEEMRTEINTVYII